MSTRNYNKIFTHTDREEGSDKILLGYENDTRELILLKNKETVFHIPFYTESILLSNSTLIRDGATAGPFPAAADRIFKNHKNYGNTTPYGSPSEMADGIWFCSWLYKDFRGTLQWMDRYYNPGSFVNALAVSQLSDAPIYNTHNPVYRDVPSTMSLESGVQYRYVHMGEKSAKQMVDTFGGINNEHIKLQLDGWGSEQIDTSPDNNYVDVKTTGTFQEIYAQLTESDRVSANTLNFNNTKDTTVHIEYNNSYALANEYSLSFWAQSNNWKETQSTNLVGNFSTKGGAGVFIDTLSSYPFFVIPETGFGHMLYVNGAYNQFLDKSLHPAVSLTASPVFVAIDSNDNVVIANADESRRVRKIDHMGKTIAETSLPTASEFPMQLLCGQYDTTVVITNKARHTYDNELTLVESTLWETLSTTVAAFAYDVENDTAELISVNGVYDCKFIGGDCWATLATGDFNTDGDLYVKYAGDTDFTLFAEYELGDIATTIAIDPYDRIWVLHGNNKLSVYDTNSDPGSDPLFERHLGLDSPYARKSISFMCIYDRLTNTREWRCIMYYGDTSRNLENPQIYVLNMKGILIRTIDILSLFDLHTLQVLKQDQSALEFFGKGDFTGYERKRVFNKISPYKNTPQLILKATLKDSTKTILPYTQFKQYYSLADWNAKSWQHILVVLKNRTFVLYVNGVPVITMPYSGKYDVTYESQPALFIGTTGGFQYGFNSEIGHVTSIFNGLFQNITMYDYAIDPANMELFQRAAIVSQNIYWTLPTPKIQYIETIERMFKNKIPGAKSSYFNIKVCGSTIKDATTRMIIEEEIRNIVEKIKPTYTNFLKVQWVD